MTNLPDMPFFKDFTESCIYIKRKRNDYVCTIMYEISKHVNNSINFYYVRLIFLYV